MVKQQVTEEVEHNILVVSSHRFTQGYACSPMRYTLLPKKHCHSSQAFSKLNARTLKRSVSSILIFIYSKYKWCNPAHQLGPTQVSCISPGSHNCSVKYNCDYPEKTGIWHTFVLASIHCHRPQTTVNSVGQSWRFSRWGEQWVELWGGAGGEW